MKSHVMPAAAILAFAAVIGVAMSPQLARAASDTGMEARVEKLEAQVTALQDKDAIRELLIEYGKAFDSHDFTAYANLFAQNGDWTGFVGGKKTTITGRDSIRNIIGGAYGTPKGEKPAPQSSAHIMTNALISLDGDTAQATSKWTFVVAHPGKTDIFAVGEYDDVLVRTTEGWKFLHRIAPSVLVPAPATAAPKQ